MKGGFALIARVGPGVRGTKDIDANWRSTHHELENTIAGIEELDLADWFNFDVGDGRPLPGEGENGAIRYSVTARLDGRVFEQLSLDVNVVGRQDSRPVELVTFQRNPFEFVGEPTLEVPMITPAQQLAEKLHAYARSYDGETSSRTKELYDMLVIADLIQLPRGSALTAAVQQTFRVRATAWPPELLPPPPDWATAYQTFVTDYPLRWMSLPDAFTALARFWQPVLMGTAYEADAVWDPREWRWT